MIAIALRDLGPHAMFYLAAAVSDFYVPWETMVHTCFMSFETFATYLKFLQLEIVFEMMHTDDNIRIAKRVTPFYQFMQHN